MMEGDLHENPLGKACIAGVRARWREPGVAGRKEGGRAEEVLHAFGWRASRNSECGESSWARRAVRSGAETPPHSESSHVACCDARSPSIERSRGSR